jgi:amino acid adenylation domain-containing protein
MAADGSAPAGKSVGPGTAAVAVDYDPFAAGGEILRTVASTEAQRELWLADTQGRGASLAYNESVEIRFAGTLDPAAMRAALTSLVERHEALRSTFSADGLALNVNAAPATLEVPIADLSQLEEAARDAQLGDMRRRQVDEPFDLVAGPLFRAEIARTGADRHTLFMTAHHIVCDGWSAGILVKDLAAAYARARGGAGADPPAAERYSDYALAERQRESSPETAAHERFWVERFAGSLPPPLELPGDRARPALRGTASDRIDHELAAPLVKAVKQLGARNGSSFFAAMTAGFAGLLSRLTGQTDLVVGIPAAGQAAGGHDRLVGHCVNMMPLRIAIDPQAGFSALVKSVRTALLDATEHQELTFGSLLKKLPLPRDPSRLPLVTVVFNVDQAIPPDAAVFPGLGWELGAVPRTHETFELFVNAVEHPGGLRVECQYSRDLFDAGTVRRWLTSLETLLAAAVAAGADAPLGRLDILGADDRATLARFNATDAATPRGVRVESLIAAQAGRTPERAAVTFGGVTATYAELEARANRLARCLRRRGVGRGTLVGVALERSSDMLAAVLAVMKAGGTYVPLDPSYPAARLALMVDDSRMSVSIARRDAAAALGFEAARTLSPDADAAEIAGEVAEPPPALDTPADAEDAAYVIYTSGSTGKPKGVRVPHRALANFLVSMQSEPGVAAADRLLAVTTLSFDIAELELLLPLTVGATVVLASQDEATDGVALRKLLETSGATVMQATPASWRMLIEAGWTGGPRFRALCGGEAMRPDLAEALLARTGELWNMYGPTETTVWSTCWRVQNPRFGIWIGKPIANTQVHVLDERMLPCPIGVPGEVFIAGDGVALGYLDRPELTAERFVADPFAGGDARMYRTGDLGRWRADGQLECLGRTDHQVKIRGYRIELGEIEAALAAHPGIGRVVAMAREDRPGDVRLVAYVVAAGAAAVPADDELRRHLAKTLPEYMIPAHFVALPALPLLPNGKIDRHKLPAPAGEARPAGAAFVAPRDATEALVAGVFQDLLAVPRIGVNDNFFMLGGHSLLAAQGAARLSRLTGRTVTMRTLFEAPTVAALAERLVPPAAPGAQAAPSPADGAVRAATVDADAPPVIPRRADRARAPLSLMQQRLWFLEELQPDRIVHNVPSAHRLLGPLDESAFQRAFDEMLRRQDALRTRLGLEDGAPYQEVLPALDLPPLFPAEDLSGLPTDERERVLAERLRTEIDTPFKLTEAPLFRTRVYRLGPEEHVFQFILHHAIWDGWSFDLLYEEMAAHYEAFRTGAPSPLPPLPVSYGDFAAWHRGWMQGEELTRQVAYWKQQLAGTLEPLEPPTDRPRPAIGTEDGRTEWVTFPAEEVARLRELGQHKDATLFMALLGAFYVMLHRLTGQRDLIVGMPVRGRAHAELEKVMGFFVNALPLRLRVDPAESFLDLLARLRPLLLDAFSHQDVPFEHLVHELRVPRDESRAPITQAFFSYQDVRRRPTSWGNLRHGRQPVFPRAAAQDVSLWFVENARGLIGGLNYATDLFDDATAKLWGGRFVGLLRAILTQPDLPIGDLPIATADETVAVGRWNAATAADTPRGVRVEALFEQQARRTPERAAITVAGVATSYADLDARANRLARCLRKRGVGRGTLVGIALERSADMLAAVLGVMKAGATYVPLDPSYPPARLSLMVDDSKMAVLVARRDDAGDLGFAPARTLAPDADAAEIAAESADPPPPLPDPAGPEDAAYLIYTSGSTGRPKGVRVPHRGVVNFLASMRAEPGLSQDDRLLAVTTLSFDIAVLELLLPLTVGAEIVLASLDDATDGLALAKLLETSRATVMQATPATWRMLIEAGWRGGPAFRALCGGEALAPDLAAALLERTGQLWNMYGPTETTVWSTCWRVEQPDRGIWIGKPIANTQVWVLDERGRRCPIGVPGELYIAGDGVALGYLDRPELTAERFVPDPFAGGDARMYRTGDLGRWRHDGMLECLGRTDFQVKVRGYRIELGEIETTLASHPAVAQAVVVARPGPGGEKQLCAYVIPRHGESPTGSELRKHARVKLPDYMVPPTYLTVEAFPLTPNGKIDRRALPAPQTMASAEPDAAFTPPSTPTEVALAEVWGQLLGTKTIGAGDNFFDLGGHSLLVMQAIAAMERRIGRRLGPRPFIFGTLAQVAAAYDGAGASAAPPASDDDRGGRGLLKGIFSRLTKT